MPSALALLVLAAVTTAARAALCDLPYCQCAPATHPSWTTVNCTVPHNQRVDILDGDLPESTTELVITGAEAVMFGANSLSRLEDARLVQLRDIKIILMRRFAAVNLNVVNLYLDVRSCDLLRLEERTFTNVKGPLSVTIEQCEVVSLEGEAFSWLLSVNIVDVHRLELSPSTFVLDPTAANVGEHGPGMTISFKNLAVQEFTSQTFGSSAASITLESVTVGTVRPDSFTANTYNVVTARNSTFELIERDAFSKKTLINNLRFEDCTIRQLATGALTSAIANLNISNTKIETIETGAVKITVAIVTILDSEINTFKEKGFELYSWSKLQMERNKIDEMGPNALLAQGATVHEVVFTENEIETSNENSLGFLGETQSNFDNTIEYKNNYFGQACQCNIGSWLLKVVGSKSRDFFYKESFCTVNEFFARCFNVPEQNMIVKSFIDEVCSASSTINCEPFKSKTDGKITEIKNPRFPHKVKDWSLSDRDKKVIGIVIISIVGVTLIAMMISFIRRMTRRGHCLKVKNFLISTNTACASLCDRMCSCRGDNSLDNAGSISQLSVNEYSERHCLNEPRLQEILPETTLPETTLLEPTLPETTLPDMCTQDLIPMEDKTTQTLPEELTKELLESLREKLDDPENYAEAREMIEHLYEMIKVEESCNTPALPTGEENIYDLPFQNTVPRLGRNKKQMISIGTRTPSLDKLTPLSPYNRHIALAHEYFEPKDLTVHLYAEITNQDKDKRNVTNVMPDIVAEQAAPRGPYLRAVRDKINSSANSSPTFKPLHSFMTKPLSLAYSAPSPSLVHSAQSPRHAHSAQTPSPAHSAPSSSSAHSARSPSLVNSAQSPSPAHSASSPSPAHSVRSPSLLNSAQSPSPTHSARSPSLVNSAMSPSPAHLAMAPSPAHSATIKSNKSTSSNSSAKMINRPLPEKPITFDPGEGTSLKQLN